MLELVVNVGVAYSALSSVFINIPCVSRLQWHPFSVTSSPCDETLNNFFASSRLESGQTGYTALSLRRIRRPRRPAASSQTCCSWKAPTVMPRSFSLNMLLLVAGGIGITPFIAILRDLFHRYQADERGLPKSVQLIWTVKRGSELVLLTDIFPAKSFSHATMHFECFAFLTGRDTRYDTGEVSLIHGEESKNEMTMNFPNVSSREGSLSPVAATGSGLWISSLIAVASCATILAMYVFGRSTSLQAPVSSHHVALLYFGSTVVGIGGFGGAVMMTWSILRHVKWGESCKNNSVYDEEGAPAASFPLPDRENVWQRNLLDNTHVMRGHPNMRKHFNAAANYYRGKDVGVLVCGPESLQVSVATECKSHYMSSSLESPFFFHSVSFDM